MKALRPLVLLALLQPLSSSGQSSPLPTTTIAFGSCNKQDLPQPAWTAILADKPDLWIWMGDNIYADTNDPTRFRLFYERQNHIPEYAHLRQTIPIVGTWDDHDYGCNDAGSEYPLKKESQTAFLDFIGVAADSPRRSQEGVYSCERLGSPGQRVAILCLDTRYHRDPPGANGDILGPAQWAWLEKELTNSDAQVHIIVSSIQVIPEEHRFEKWANFPKARKRLFDLLRSTQPANPVLLSGDRHLAEISRVDLAPPMRVLWEITSSGLTHSFHGVNREVNRYRVGDNFTGLNYGLLIVRWLPAGPEVSATVRDATGKSLLAAILSPVPEDLAVPITLAP